MIAISSHRALSDSAEVARNQIRAKTSWNLVFDSIVYFGPEENELKSHNTAFIETEDFPTISSLFFTASQMDDFTVILNADIVVDPKLRSLMRFMIQFKDLWAVTSHRWEFQGEQTDSSQVKDHGVDFFGAWPQIWQMAWKEVPSTYRIGHNAWDSWMLGFLNTKFRGHFWDITEQQCIFHPVHQERKRVYPIVEVPGYDGTVGFPVLKM